MVSTSTSIHDIDGDDYVDHNKGDKASKTSVLS